MKYIFLFAAPLIAAAGCAERQVETPHVITNSIGMKLVLIPAGEFLMGSPEGENGRHYFAGPQHRVKITKEFYMGTTEVTQAQWKVIMGYNPSDFIGDDLPVESVSWDECQTFLKILSAKEGKKYRLPTEAEWEYACRAGSPTKYYFGENYEKLDEYGWYGENSDGTTHPVGGKRPNAWGLYDMHGNVDERCQDFFGKDYYKNSPAANPTGPESGESRVDRGGCWRDIPRSCGSASRNSVLPDIRRNYLGFRVVLEYRPVKN
jgi:formylglycine-generating enzyme required for sulfatase activity